ncbi:MAG: glycosyltransferase [Microcoleaceae cyanobacterium MO_207.B10]|nr:glycosyltransferase [Microcoleaceae cyanobacterium MO_207.B10]
MNVSNFLMATNEFQQVCESIKLERLKGKSYEDKLYIINRINQQYGLGDEYCSKILLKQKDICHTDIIIALAQVNKINSILELGVSIGKNCVEIIRNSNLNYYGIDANGISEFLEQELSREEKRSVNIIQGNTQDNLSYNKLFPGSSLPQLIFMDASHSYNELKQEFMAMVNKLDVEEDYIILVDDIGSDSITRYYYQGMEQGFYEIAENLATKFNKKVHYGRIKVIGGVDDIKNHIGFISTQETEKVERIFEKPISIKYPLKNIPIEFAFQNQENTQTKLEEGIKLRSQGNSLKALLALEEFLKENPENVTALLELGKLSLKLEDLQAAKQLFAKAVSLERRNSLAMELLAKILIDLKEYQEAANILEHLVKIQPQNLSALSLLENCYRQIGKEEEATSVANHYCDLEAGNNVATLPTNLSEKFISKIKPKRILVINNLYPPQELGGYGRRICDFANVLGKRGHTIHALASDAPYLGEIKSPETNVTRELLLCGTYEELPPKHFADKSEVQRVIAHNDSLIRKTIENYAPDVCLLGNIDLLGNSIFLPLLENSIPVIHLLGFAQPGYPVDSTPNSPLYFVGANSEYGRQGVIKQGYPLDEVGVVYPGAFIEQFQMCCLPNVDKLRIVFASLVLPYKGPQTLIEALAILHYAGIDFECSIAGDAPNTDFLNALQNVAQTRGFDSKVDFLGYLPRQELIELFANNNVLVFPSVWEEPFGRSQVEAMAAGLTLISSGTGGSAEIVERGISGLTFPPGNAFALAEALMGLTKNPEQWQEIAIAGQKRAELFDITRSIDFLEEKFEELLRMRNGDVKFLEEKYLPSLQEKLQLREINLIIFPDWSQPEETVGLELQEVIKSLVTHPDRGKMTLLIDNSNISAEEADLILSSVAMNLLMEAELEVDEGPEIFLVGELSQIQWSTLIPQLQGRIKLEHENEEVKAQLKADNIPVV